MWYGNNRILLCANESTAKVLFDTHGVKYAASGCFFKRSNACQRRFPPGREHGDVVSFGALGECLWTCGFLNYQVVHNVKHGIEIFDVFAALYPVLTIDNQARCAGDTEKLYITLTFTQLAVRCK